MDGPLAHLLNFPLLLIYGYINFTKEYLYFLPVIVENLTPLPNVEKSAFLFMFAKTGTYLIAFNFRISYKITSVSPVCDSGMFSRVPQVGCCSWQSVSNCLKFAESNRLLHRHCFTFAVPVLTGDTCIAII